MAGYRFSVVIEKDREGYFAFGLSFRVAIPRVILTKRL